MRQLQLDIEPQLDARISDFSGPGWGHVIDAVRQLHAGLISRFYVYGGAGTGKVTYSLPSVILIWKSAKPLYRCLCWNFWMHPLKRLLHWTGLT